jgi:putative ABC transport system permease protein
MKFLPLIWRSLLRHKLRTLLTIGSTFVTFFLFGVLMTLRMSFTMGVDIAGVDRLMTMHKTSIIQFLPVSYANDMRAVPGVVSVTHNTWFGGIYQDPKNFFAQVAVEPEGLLTAYKKELKVPAEQVKAWEADRQGAMVGADVAKRFGWKLGDRIPLMATIWQPLKGQEWDFNIDAIYDATEGFDKTQFFFQYDYLEENRLRGKGNASWFIINIDDPSKSAEIAAKIDALFANSSAETKTATEKVFVQSFAKQIGDIGTIITTLVTVVLFLLLMVVANVMGEAVRERTSEVGVLKTLGFSNGLVLWLILAESMVLACIGGALGLGLWKMIVTAMGDPTGGMLPIFVLGARDVAIGVVLMLVLGFLAGILPATNAMRLRITDALRRV